MNFWKNLHPLLRREIGGDTTNSAVLETIAHVLEEAEGDTKGKKTQLSLSYATGHYLDVWGLWFNTVRKNNESDKDLLGRIVGTVEKPSGTIPSIVGETQGASVYEPWRDIFTLNASKLNGEDHLGGDYFRYGVVDVQLSADVVSQSLVDRLLEVKPAGVFMYITLSTGDRYLLSNNKYQDEEHIYNDNFVKVLYGSNRG